MTPRIKFSSLIFLSCFSLIIPSAIAEDTAPELRPVPGDATITPGSTSIKLPYTASPKTRNGAFLENDAPLKDDVPVSYKAETAIDESYDQKSKGHTAAMMSAAAAALGAAIVLPMLQPNVIHTRPPDQAKGGSASFTTPSLTGQ